MYRGQAVDVAALARRLPVLLEPVVDVRDDVLAHVERLAVQSVGRRQNNAPALQGQEVVNVGARPVVNRLVVVACDIHIFHATADLLDDLPLQRGQVLRLVDDYDIQRRTVAVVHELLEHVVEVDQVGFRFVPRQVGFYAQRVAIRRAELTAHVHERATREARERQC